MKRSSTPTVAIIGAGAGGLLMAIRSKRAGIKRRRIAADSPGIQVPLPRPENWAAVGFGSILGEDSCPGETSSSTEVG
jgi:thioredoxin reductase